MNENPLLIDASRLSFENVSINIVGEFISLFCLAILVHALALRFVFPGFYDPLMFEHSDFYMPVALRYGGTGIFSMLNWPRPIGMVYLYATGWLGTNGYILTTIGIILSNIVLISISIRKLCKIEIDTLFILGFSIFCFCLFCQPYFFTMAVHDSLAQTSFTFIAIAIVMVLPPGSRSPKFLPAFFLLMLLGFLSKEAYALSAFFLLSLIGVAQRKLGLMRAFGPLALSVAAFIVAYAYNLHVKSGFLLGSDEMDSTYKQTHNIFLIIDGSWKYTNANMTTWTGFVLLLNFLLILFFAEKTLKLIVISLIIAAYLAIIPNSVLPRHFFPGYGWNTGYLLFAPFLLVPAIFDRIRGRVGRICYIAVTISTVVLLPHFWRPIYAANDWTLIEANIQKNVRKSLDALTANAAFGAVPRRVLVTGIDFPFSPFQLGPALREWTGKHDVRFDVVNYGTPRDANPPVRFLAPAEIKLDDYTDVWAFRSDGTATEINSYTKFPNIDFLGERDLILYPSAIETLGSNHFLHSPGPTTGAQYLQCGLKLAGYNAHSLAITAFQKSIAATPANPYAFFLEAQSYEALGRHAEALEAAQTAVSTDNPTSPNIYFRQFLDHLKSNDRS